MTLKELGLPPEATAEDVRQAYKRLASSAHPDKGGTSEEFQRLQHIRDTAMVETTTKKDCLECAGSGSKYVGSGFSRMKMPCEVCGGTGAR